MNTMHGFFAKSLKAALGGALLSVFTFAMTGCSDFDNGYTEKEIQYNQSFGNEFGDVDPNHNFNTAGLAKLGVTINFPGEYTVKVYTANPRYESSKCYLLGQFDKVSAGYHIFNCDVPVTLEYIYIGIIDKDNNRMIQPAVLKDGKASVEFGQKGTRSVLTENSGGEVKFEKTTSKKWTLADLKAPIETLPENVLNAGKVTQNFEFASLGSFIIYPIYCVTSNRGSYGNPEFGERLGIYTLNSDGSKSDVTWIWRMNKGVIEDGEITQSTWYQAHKTGESDSKWHNMYWFIEGIYNDSNPNASNTVWDEGNKSFRSGFDAIRSEGIKINIAPGVRFGFVLETDAGNYYSNSRYNKDQGRPINATGCDLPDNINDTYAATFHRNGAMYIAFEDWNYGSAWNYLGPDHDFNDVVFQFVKTNDSYLPLVIDKDSEVPEMIYIVACEDLGGTEDWDFNDIVFGIKHISGQTKATVSLLAAGGVLPAEIYYQDKKVTFGASNKTEVHDVFGIDLANTEKAADKMVNTGLGVTRAPVESNNLTVNAQAFSVFTDAADFKISVKYAGSETFSKASISVPDRKGEAAAQAFLIADPTWEWPIERQKISIKYPDFTTWVRDLQTAKNWTNTVWGESSEFYSLPSEAVNLLNVNGAVTYKNNVATVKLDHNQLNSLKTYKLVVLTSSEASILFKLNDNGQKIQDMPDGKIRKDQITTFSFDNNVVNAIIGQHGGTLDITFASGKVAKDELRMVYWYEEGLKKNPYFEVINKDINLGIPDGSDIPTAQIYYSTVNTDEERTVSFLSSNPGVATVSSDGVVTAVAAGTATITVRQSSTTNYSGGDQYVTVTVAKRDPRLSVDQVSVAGNLYGGVKTITATSNNNLQATPLIVSSANTNVATVTAENQHIRITPVGVGTTTISIQQPANGDYADSEVITVGVTVELGTEITDKMTDDQYPTNANPVRRDENDNIIYSESWHEIAAGDITAAANWNITNGLKIVFNFDGVYGINNFYVRAKGTDAKLWAMKEGASFNSNEYCTWDEGKRNLVFTITKDDFETYFQGSSWKSHFFFGGSCPAPTRVYVGKY